MTTDSPKNSANSTIAPVGSVDVAHVPESRDTHLYLLGEVGHIYTYSQYPSNATAEPMCTILGLAVDADRLRLEIDGREYNELACIAAPQTSTMLPCHARTVAFVFYPPTATHRALQILPKPRIQSLDREQFREFDAKLIDAATGALTLSEATALFHAVAAKAANFLPTPPALDTRIAAVAGTLFGDPTIPIDSLASMVKLSSDRLSHLFTDTIGIDLRRYRLWLKIGRASLAFASNQNINMSEMARLAGFSDSAHLSRAVKEVYGGSPTRFLAGMKIHGPTN
jgi:AraC-like DNA-binding protein